MRLRIDSDEVRIVARQMHAEGLDAPWGFAELWYPESATLRRIEELAKYWPEGGS